MRVNFFFSAWKYMRLAVRRLLAVRLRLLASSALLGRRRALDLAWRSHLGRAEGHLPIIL